MRKCYQEMQFPFDSSKGARKAEKYLMRKLPSFFIRYFNAVSASQARDTIFSSSCKAFSKFGLCFLPPAFTMFTRPRNSTESDKYLHSATSAGEAQLDRLILRSLFLSRVFTAVSALSSADVTLLVCFLGIVFAASEEHSASLDCTKASSSCLSIPWAFCYAHDSAYHSRALRSVRIRTRTPTWDSHRVRSGL